MSEDRRLLGIGARLAAVLCLSVMYAMVKLLAARGVTLIESMFYRQAFALPLVAVWIAVVPGLRSVRTVRLGAHIWRSALGLTGMVLIFSTYLLLPLAEATTILFSVPIFATILSAVVLREPTGWHRWCAVLIGFVGVITVAQPGSAHIAPAGILVGLAAALIVAWISITLRQIGRTESAATTVFWFTIFSTTALAFAMPFAAREHDWKTFAMLIALGFAGGAGQLFLTASLRLAPVSIVLPMDYSNLLWSTLLGWAIFATLPTTATWAGAPLIIASGLYIVYREHRLHCERTAAASVID